MTWTPWALPAVFCLLMAWGAAFVLLRTMSGRSLNRRLAAVQFLEGVWLGGGVFFVIEDPSLFRAVATVSVAAMASLPFLYLSFLAVSVRTPLVRPFRSRFAFGSLTLGSVALALWVIASPGTFIGGLYSPPWATWNFLFTATGQRLALIHAAASLFGLVAALDAWRRAERGTAARARAKWFAVAFGIRDVYVGFTYALYPVLRDLPFWGDLIYNPGTGAAYFLYLALMAYAVLHTQLFDLQLKLKFALAQSTVGAVFAAAFFVGSELLERLVPVEGTILGLLVAGAIVLVLRPVQRLARAFADRVLGRVDDTPRYLRARKHEVYRAALEGALEDGAITEKERSILGRLREQLEIPAEAAEALEREIAAAAS